MRVWLGGRKYHCQTLRRRGGQAGEKGVVAVGDPQADAPKLSQSLQRHPLPRFNYLICLFAFILIWPLMKMQFGKNLQVKSNYHFLGLIIKLSPPGTERDLTENSRTWLGRKEVHIQSPTRADRVG